MESNEYDEVIVSDEEENNEETTEEVVEETHPEKPKRTPQEEYDYHTGKAKRLAKKLGLAEEAKPFVKSESSKPSELDYGQMALLRTEGIKGSGETALFKEIMSETGKGVLDVLDSNYFKSRLADFRESQASANAVPKGKGRSAQTGSTGIDVAVAKYKEDGKLPTDFKTRSAVVKAIESEESGISAGFDGPSVSR